MMTNTNNTPRDLYVAGYVAWVEGADGHEIDAPEWQAGYVQASRDNDAWGDRPTLEDADEAADAWLHGF